MMMRNTSNNDEKYPARISSKGSNVVLNPLQCSSLVPKSYVMLAYSRRHRQFISSLTLTPLMHFHLNLQQQSAISNISMSTIIMSNISTCIARCLLHAKSKEARRTNPVPKKRDSFNVWFTCSWPSRQWSRGSSRSQGHTSKRQSFFSQLSPNIWNL